ncbi:MAG: ATP-dependent Clp protease ATP-binding subunit, partial [Clostridia bacterium]|nr:ATP-dependent Clp protease ATP-binding subunit [Clostridia bacterium]
DAANLLKPALARGRLRLIGATTDAEYRKTIANDGAMERRFQPIPIPEPDEETTFAILSGLRPLYEQYHGVLLPDETLRAAVRLTVRYLSDRRLPDKAIDCMDEAAAYRHLENTPVQPPQNTLAEQRNRAIAAGNLEAAAKLTPVLRQHAEQIGIPSQAQTPLPVVTPSDIAAVLTRRTGIPIPEQKDALAAPKTAELEEILLRRVIGQDEAVRTAAAAVRRQLSGLRDPDRPAVSLLLLGPTGVGKTELARALTAALFGDDSRMIRLDMSEYGERNASARLIGAPPGYVGYEAGGFLTEQVQKHPYSLLLFDEIEKAHPDVLDLFLQLLDEGRLTDGHGRTVDFRNTVILMTSNVGADPKSSVRHPGFLSSEEDSADDTDTVLRQSFRPEFINRIDAVLRFRPLDRPALIRITKLLLEKTTGRLAEHGITLHISDAVVRYLAKAGYSPVYGARPLRRVIAEQIEGPLSDALLSGKIKNGDTVRMALLKNKPVLKKCAAAPGKSAPEDVHKTGDPMPS